jgi:hypothetical protein
MVNTWPNVWEQQPTLQRALILRYLFDIYISDVDFGGIDVGVEAELAMIEQTTLEERAEVIGWVQEQFNTSTPDSLSDWRRQTLETPKGRVL